MTTLLTVFPSLSKRTVNPNEKAVCRHGKITTGGHSDCIRRLRSSVAFLECVSLREQRKKRIRPLSAQTDAREGDEGGARTRFLDAHPHHGGKLPREAYTDGKSARGRLLPEHRHAVSVQAVSRSFRQIHFRAIARVRWRFFMSFEVALRELVFVLTDLFVSETRSVSSRQRLLLWTCEAHNEVNQRNGKPLFPCTLKEMDKRWGDCGCH